MNIKEVSLDTYREFDSMQELVKAMARTQTVWSWGARGWANYYGKFLRFRVSGHLFKGLVWVGVNGSDLLDIHYTNLQGEIKAISRDIHVDDLLEVIDVKVERIAAYKR